MNANEIKKITAAWAAVMLENRDFLVKLDSVAGDGDIGLVLSDGFRKVDEAITNSDQQDIGKLVYQIGKTLSAEAPSSMGTLLANGFMRAGKVLQGQTEFGISALGDMMKAIADGIMDMGGAKEGEKTALDSLLPGLRALREKETAPVEEALCSAYEAAAKGFENTRDMVAKHGRIAFRGENSRTIADPGAAAVMLLYKGMMQALTSENS